MDDIFKIYVEQLREGHEEQIQETIAPDFLEIHEADLKFEQPVLLNGLAYIAERELVLQWNIQTEARISCSICNELVKVPIVIRNFYHSEPLSEIKTGIYNFKDLLRETILLEVPPFAECEGGQCPKRVEYGKFLINSSDQPNEGEGYRPFADLES